MMRVFTDGSGDGYVCAVFGDSQETAAAHFKKINDPLNHEYQAVLHALSFMNSKEPYDIFIDCAGVVDHIDGSIKPPTRKNPKIMRWLTKIWEYLEDNEIQVNFYWIRRDRNPAGFALDKYLSSMRKVMTETSINDPEPNKRIVLSDRGSSNNLEMKLHNPNRYAHWPKKKNTDDQVGCPKCSSLMNRKRPCEICGFNLITGKVNLEK